ncbi:MAG TPA: hypothetical protein VK737_06550 [Opitutales bacterium]|jgi:hypothetical protein|nr:hypothetical protein [Opitutales bacterium]
MNVASIVGRFMLWSAIAGGLGAVVMVMVLWAFTKSGLVNARMIVAVGSLITRSYDQASKVGWLMHAVAGVFFAQLYTLTMLAIAEPGFGTNLLWGIAFGMFHGLFMSLILIGAVADTHPLPEFRQRSFAIALSHWVGHVAYGAVVGAVIGASGIVVAH